MVVRIIGIVLVIGLATFATGPTLANDNDKPWPHKDDTVYLSVALSAVQLPMISGMKAPDLKALDSCVPLMVKKASEGTIIVRDDSAVDRGLEGEWGGSIHPSLQACRAASTADPDIRAVAERRPHRMVPIAYRLVRSGDHPSPPSSPP